ncbi:centrosomal protein cep57l1-like isoform X1 [Acipenser oxyrinchus oxyrinchus]|uniref:Centrosomal protein 57kDa-like protein 1 n=1 Tax=Acipenser oxyrinchus oxyrinchus TaxID=40147 RepID=A0AAD8GCM9_ACIOX|nr:centrosomal protein cep57l1-like isoform X1 [Acipenser oxyrinchus oxyrinchus]
MGKKIHQQSMGSSFKHSYFGSFQQLPEKIPSALFVERKHHCDTVPQMVGIQNISSEIARGKSESSTQAVISALKTLQEKICRLELERTQAENNLKSLCEKALQHKHLSEQEKSESNLVQKQAQQKTELTSQLRSAEARCSLLEKQLDYMRKMVEIAEHEKNETLKKQVLLQKERIQDQVKVHSKLEKLEELEQQCLKLTATQTKAEMKIQQLEQKLLKEEHQCKLVQQKAAQLQTGLEITKIIQSSLPAECKPKKKTKNTPAKNISSAKKELPVPPIYRKAKTLHFVAGTSTSPSHSVRANVQNVLHIMKYHNPKLYDGSHTLPMRFPRSTDPAAKRSFRRPASSCSATSSVGSLSELLLALQDELGQMSFEHQELLKHIQETRKTEVREDLERELDCLVKRMEVKGDQISKLKKHQAAVQKLKQKSQKVKRRLASAGAQTEVREVKPLSATLSHRGPSPKPTKGHTNQGSLQLLKNVQKLQLNLKKDDIMWVQ